MQPCKYLFIICLPYISKAFARLHAFFVIIFVVVVVLYFVSTDLKAKIKSMKITIRIIKHHCLLLPLPW